MTDSTPVVTLLDRPLYTVGEAARLLEIPGGTLRRWLDGVSGGAATYEPVIRRMRTGSGEVTWAEFIEAGFLREYRRTRVSLQRLRRFIDDMRQWEGVEYPLAQLKPLVDRPTKSLLTELEQLQRKAELPPELCLVGSPGGQLVWRAPMKAFLEKVEFDRHDGTAVRMHPLGQGSPITIDPRVAFGIPQVKGVRTETIAEAVANEDQTEADVAAGFGLSVEDVQAAIRWELRLRRSAARAA